MCIRDSMYSHFKLFACQPVIFCNVLDIATAKEASAATDVAVTEHKVKLPIAAINDSALVIKPAGGTGSAYVSGTDYNAYYSGEHLVVELLSTGSAYDAEQVNIAYNKVKASTVTASDIASAMENVELCLTLLGIGELRLDAADVVGGALAVEPLAVHTAHQHQHEAEDRADAGKYRQS